MHSLLLLFIIIQSSFVEDRSSADAYATLFGYVNESETGETLIAANLYFQESDFGTTTNTSGYYQVRHLKPGAYKIRVSYIGFETHEEVLTLEPGEQKRHDFNLRQGGYKLEELTITSDKEQEEYLNLGRRDISMHSIGQMPGGLQDDLFRTIQLLPGIAAASDFSSGLHIRGGSPDQTLIQMDGTTIYSPTHFFGFFSAFNSDAIKEVQLYKGTYPAEFGGRLGSVVDIYNKDGNRNRHAGVFSLGMLSSRAMAEGPIPKGSYMIAYRRSTLEPLLALIREEVDGVPDNFYFYDINAKINYEHNNRNRFGVVIYNGTDNLTLPYDEKLHFNFLYGNRTLSAFWTHIASSSLFVSFRFSGSQFFNNPVTDHRGTSHERDNTVDEFSLIADLEWFPSVNHSLSAGIVGGRIESTLADRFDDRLTFQSNNQSWKASSYLQSKWRLTPKWRINSGIRGHYFSSGDYWRVSPRLAIDYFLTQQLRFQAGYGRYYQFLTMSTDSAIPGFDVWLLADQHIQPSSGDQFGLGAKYRFRKNWMFELEGYYRTMNDLFELDPTLGDIAGFEYHELFRIGEGYAYGMEALVERSRGMVNGFIAYTYGRTWRRFPNYNQDRFFPPRFDRTHDFTAVLNYQFSKKWQLSSTWTYQTGQAYTKPTGWARLEFGQTRYLIIGKVNASRIPDYHRLDLAMTRKGSFFSLADSELQFQVINVYSRRNVWFYSFDFDENTVGKKAVYLLPVLPSVNYTLRL